MAILFDIETDGFIEHMTTVHVMCIKDLDHDIVVSFKGADVAKGVEILERATRQGRFIVAHNGIGFDIPALKKLYPEFNPDMNFVRDTLVMTRLMFADLLDSDLKLIAAGKLPNKMLKRHSLEAWGYRLGEHKIDYLEWCATAGVENPWGQWSQEMDDYCQQDVLTMEKLWKFLLKGNYPDFPIQLEHQVAVIVQRQVTHGFLFDKDKAGALYAKLVEHKTRIEDQLKLVFLPKVFKLGPPEISKVNNKKTGRIKGELFQKTKLVEFNPGSRDHVGIWLKALHGWVPKDFTNDGKPKVDETILLALPYPEAKLLAEYYMVAKRVGQVAEGDQAWLRHVKADGRIHGGVITNGAVTGRMTHATPNLAQVPAGSSPYGHECRDCFTVPKGKKLVGADASALELRCLAGYMAKWDNGEYIKTVVDGKKEDGTEIHTVNRKALQIESRDDAKTWFLWKTKGTPQSNLEKNNCVNSGNSQHGQS